MSTGSFPFLTCVVPWSLAFTLQKQTAWSTKKPPSPAIAPAPAPLGVARALFDRPLRLPARPASSGAGVGGDPPAPGRTSPSSPHIAGCCEQGVACCERLACFFAAFVVKEIGPKEHDGTTQALKLAKGYIIKHVVLLFVTWAADADMKPRNVASTSSPTIRRTMCFRKPWPFTLILAARHGRRPGKHAQPQAQWNSQPHDSVVRFQWFRNEGK